MNDSIHLPGQWVILEAKDEVVCEVMNIEDVRFVKVVRSVDVETGVEMFKLSLFMKDKTSLGWSEHATLNEAKQAVHDLITSPVKPVDRDKQIADLLGVRTRLTPK